MSAEETEKVKKRKKKHAALAHGGVEPAEDVASGDSKSAGKKSKVKDKKSRRLDADPGRNHAVNGMEQTGEKTTKKEKTASEKSKKRKAGADAEEAVHTSSHSPADGDSQEGKKKKDKKNAANGTTAAGGDTGMAGTDLAVNGSLAGGKKKQKKQEKQNGMKSEETKGGGVGGEAKDGSVAVHENGLVAEGKKEKEALVKEIKEKKKKKKSKEKTEAGTTEGQDGRAKKAGSPDLAVPAVSQQQEEGVKLEKKRKKDKGSKEDKGSKASRIAQADAVANEGPDAAAAGLNAIPAAAQGEEKGKKSKKRKGSELMEAITSPEAMPTSEPLSDGSSERKKKKKKKHKAVEVVLRDGDTHAGDAEAHGDDAGMANGAPAQQGAATGSGEKAGPKGGRESGASEKNAKMFRRVVAEEWLGKKGAWDNSYSATFGDSGWGAKAEAVLGSVRGKNFRHEKTKKKRGSYRGGAITPDAVHSIKFDSDDE